MKSTSDIAPLLNTKEAAKILGVSKRTVFTLTNTGQLPSIRFGRSVRFDPADIERFIESSRERRDEKEPRVDCEAGHG